MSKRSFDQVSQDIIILGRTPDDGFNVNILPNELWNHIFSYVCERSHVLHRSTGSIVFYEFEHIIKLGHVWAALNLDTDREEKRFVSPKKTKHGKEARGGWKERTNYLNYCVWNFITLMQFENFDITLPRGGKRNPYTQITMKYIKLIFHELKTYRILPHFNSLHGSVIHHVRPDKSYKLLQKAWQNQLDQSFPNASEFVFADPFCEEMNAYHLQYPQSTKRITIIRRGNGTNTWRHINHANTIIHKNISLEKYDVIYSDISLMHLHDHELMALPEWLLKKERNTMVIYHKEFFTFRFKINGVQCSMIMHKDCASCCGFLFDTYQYAYRYFMSDAEPDTPLINFLEIPLRTIFRKDEN
jgi:hypothetical protein